MDALPASCHCSFEPATLYMTAGDEKIAASQRDRGGREHIQQVGNSEALQTSTFAASIVLKPFLRSNGRLVSGCVRLG